MASVPEIEGYSDLVQVGRGGFGIVYRARQDQFNRVVALKVLSLAAVDDRGRQRFARECRAMGALSWHPNVVAVLHSGIADDGTPWLAMEYLEGGSLGDQLRDEGPMAWEDALRVGIQVAGALGAAHASGVLHRDLKPENLLVSPFGETKLTDFGIAAVEGAPVTTTGQASFTVDHVAPEVLTGDRPDERSDLYGLASTLHMLIAGASPFAGQPGEAIGTRITRILQTAAPRLTDVPEPLADLLQQTLAKDPAARPASAEAFGRALQEIQRSAGLPATDLRLAPTGPSRATRAGTTPRQGEADDPATSDTVTSGTVEAAISRRDDGGDDSAATIRHDGPAVGLPVPGAGAPPAPAPLDAPDDAASGNGPGGAQGQGQGRRSRVLVAVAVVAVVALVGLLAAYLVHRKGEDDGGAAASSDAPATTTAPVEASVIDFLRVGESPQAVDATADSAWITSSAAGTLARVDAETEEVTTITVGSNPQGVAARDDVVWVALLDGDAVDRIDPATNAVTATVPVGDQPAGITATATDAWVTNLASGTVSRIDAATNQVVATIPVTSPRGIAATGDAVWVTNDAGQTVTRIDPATNAVTATINVGSDPIGIAATSTAVWVANAGDDTVTRIDPATSRAVATIQVGNNPVGVAATGTEAWVANFDDDTVTRILAEDNRQDVPLDVSHPVGVAATDTLVWVTNTSAGAVTLIDPGTP